MMKTVSNQNFFQAHWDLSFGRLQPTAWTKTARTAYNALSLLIPVIALARCGAYLLNQKLVRYAILPAVAKSPEYVALTRDSFFQSARSLAPESHTIATPDHCDLSVKFFRHPNSDAETPTLIYFNPNNAVLYDAPYEEVLNQLLNRGEPFNFAVFDYRNTGDSKGTFRTFDDLVVDGASVVQWVREKIGTPPDKIHFYGWSMGGAVSAHVKALAPSLTPGSYANERSFSSIDDFIDAHNMGESRSLNRCLKFASRLFGASIDVVPAFRRLEGRKIIIYHLSDPVIPYTASLNMCTSDLQCQRVSLSASANFNHHIAPLTFYRDAATQRPALEEIGDFFLGPCAAASMQAI